MLFSLSCFNKSQDKYCIPGLSDSYRMLIYVKRFPIEPVNDIFES
jgi:hypothetical protein